MRIRARDFRVTPRENVDLKKRPTKVAAFYASKDDYEKQIGARAAELSALQELFYANQQHALLVIFQAMDAAGKDGAIKHVMSGVNPQGCRVASFKHPSAREAAHDFLWRTTRQLPERGMIGIFNRSYYEEVLIVRVHPELLAAQNIPRVLTHQKTLWTGRFDSIVDFESHLARSGTKVIKVFLHISKEEQRKRFLSRVDDAEKRWKLSIADLNERRFWKDYMRAYEACLGATSTSEAPWYVVPADDKENARLVVSEIILEALRSLKLAIPKSTPQREKELKAIRKML